MGIGDMAKVILSFVIFYCFEFSACSHFVILNSISFNHYRIAPVETRH